MFFLFLALYISKNLNTNIILNINRMHDMRVDLYDMRVKMYHIRVELYALFFGILVKSDKFAE